MNGNRYFENFSSVEDIRKEFSIPDDAIADEEVLFAYYGYGCYCGAATVLFQRNGKLYEVTGSHCSCNGLEDGWVPVEVTWGQLAMRNGDYAYFEEDTDGKAKDALKLLINQHVPRA